jgi:hypothetical protein
MQPMPAKGSIQFFASASHSQWFGSSRLFVDGTLCEQSFRTFALWLRHSGNNKPNVRTNFRLLTLRNSCHTHEEYVQSHAWDKS